MKLLGALAMLFAGCADNFDDHHLDVCKHGDTHEPPFPTDSKCEAACDRDEATQCRGVENDKAAQCNVPLFTTPSGAEGCCLFTSTPDFMVTYKFVDCSDAN